MTAWRPGRLLCCALAGAAVASGCRGRVERERQVVAYCSVDQNHAEPVLRAFERRTGIRVKPVFDVEAAKTTGLVNRLLAERGRPRADVFWSGEFAQTIRLQHEGLLAPCAPTAAAALPAAYRDPAGAWFAFGGRARVLIVNTNRVPRAEFPSRVDDLLDARWPAGEVAMALPLFGTTLTHAAALYAQRGADEAQRFFAAVKARNVRIVPGNGDVRDLVARGEARWGLTDTDDAAGALARGAPVAVVFPDQEDGGAGALVIPNTVALLAGAPHPDEGAALLEFLLGPEAEALFVASGWCHVPVYGGSGRPRQVDTAGLKPAAVDLQAVHAQLERARRDLTELFLR